MQKANGFATEDLASVIFSVTPDLHAAFPPEAARQLGWTSVPLFTTVEMTVPNMAERIVRVLIHWNTWRSQDEIVHVYLEKARALRPDLTDATSNKHDS